MGRGHDVSSFDMEDTVVSTSGGKDFRSMSRRKLVAMLAIFVPVVIISSYMYFTTPDASTESLMFFQGRPVSSFLPLTGSANTSLLASNANGNDTTEVESNFEVSRNTTDSNLGTVEENIDPGAIVEAEEAKDLYPGETGNETSSIMGFSDPQKISKQKIPDDAFRFDDSATADGNDTTDAIVESSFNTTDSNLGTQPAEENTEPGAVVVAEDEKAEKLDSSESGASAKETSPSLGVPDQELGNIATVDSNSTSPDVSALTSDASKQKIPDDSSSNYQQTQQSIIEMEGQELSNTTNVKSKGACDLFKGKWVPDTRQLQYTNATCYHIQEAQNCMKNGRPDSGYLYWKWQPEHCDLPRIDHRAFLAAMRDRSMAFVGDSIARNQFQSLLCLLSQIEQPENTYASPDDKEKVFIFRSYNFTIAVYWSPYLVHVEDRQITRPNNVSEIVAADIHLDKLDQALVHRMPGVDFLQISTGQWWFKFAYYLQNGQTIGCHTYTGWPECPDVGYADPYRMAIHTVLRGVFSIPGYAGTTVFRSFAPDHFEGGSWSSNGKCVRTEPGGVPMSDMSSTMHQVQLQVFQNVTGALSASEKHRLRLLDITNLAQERPDGHPDAYRTPHPFSDLTKQQTQKDCLHWCLPGPIDTWNELLVESLHDAVYH